MKKSTKISILQWEIMLCEVLSEVPQPILCLLCKVCISLMSFWPD